MADAYPANASYTAASADMPVYGAGGEEVTGMASGGIEAFVADTVVTASNVAVVISEEEEEEQERKKYKRYMMIAGVCFVIVMVAVIVPLVVILPREDRVTYKTDAPTEAPSELPSMQPSGTPTTNSFSDLLDVLSPYAEDGIFENRNSPQYKAALWLDGEDKYFSNDRIWRHRYLQGGDAAEMDKDLKKLIQRFVMATFYYSVNTNSTAIRDDDKTFSFCYKDQVSCVGVEGRDGKPGSNFPWLSDVDECWWAFIKCSTETSEDQDVVDEINFPARGNNLHGTLPFEMTLLTGLRELLLPNNKIKGRVDNLLSKLSNLETVVLIGNSFTGTIPDVFYANNKLLGTIFFGENNFVGTISKLIGDLPLRQFRAHDNAFNGTIPAEIGNMTQLFNIQLQNNALQGTIPQQLYRASRLVTIDLGDNANLTGTIDPSVGSLKRLENFRLAGTQIGGTLPKELFTAREMVELDLSNAEFSGTLAEQFSNWNKTMMELYLNGNKFSGTIPKAFDKLTALTALHLEKNQLTGEISATICSERGVLFQQISSLKADCAVKCTCCDDYTCN